MPFRAAHLALASIAILAGCTWETELPAEVTSIHVDPDKELVITDDTVLARLGNNRDGGPTSFRRAVERLQLPEEATLRWLRAWSARLREEGSDTRATMLEQSLTTAWLRRSSSNEEKLDLNSAPFRLIAIVNRTDLSTLPDRAADGGEARLVFALTDGPADDEASKPLPLAMIIEYAQDGSALEWTRRWHSVGEAPEREWPSALGALAEDFVGKGSLAQVRTADAWTGDMVFHEFRIADREIAPANVRNTPDWARTKEDEVRDYVSSHREALADGTAVLPTSWWARSSSIHDLPPSYVFDLEGHEPLLRQTCSGCHAQSERTFQIDPLAKGRARLSHFLFDPLEDSDEIRRRIVTTQLRLFDD